MTSAVPAAAILACVSEPRVSCTSCARTWNSATMAEGLRRIGTCPRCGGPLRFAADVTAAPARPRTPTPGHAVPADLPPSQVLGVPRR